MHTHIRSAGCTAAVLPAGSCGPGCRQCCCWELWLRSAAPGCRQRRCWELWLPRDAGSAAAGLSITYDGKEGFGPGCLKCAAPERRLAHIHPGVCRGRVDDGKPSPVAVQPTCESDSVSLPLHTQLLHGPAKECKGIGDRGGESWPQR